MYRAAVKEKYGHCLSIVWVVISEITFKTLHEPLTIIKWFEQLKVTAMYRIFQNYGIEHIKFSDALLPNFVVEWSLEHKIQGVPSAVVLLRKMDNE